MGKEILILSKTFCRYKHTLPLLVILGRKETLNQTQILNQIGVKNVPAVDHAIETLEKLGLATVKMEIPLTKWVSITEKGKNVYEKLLDFLRSTQSPD